jgi:hypothetical protein
VFVWSHFPVRQVIPLGLKMRVHLVAFSEPPSVPLGLKMRVHLVAFSDPPSASTWLENARSSGRIFRSAKCFHLA